MATRMGMDDILRITNCISSLILVNKVEAETLVKRFNELATTNDKIDRSSFRDLLADTFGIDDTLIKDRGNLWS